MTTPTSAVDLDRDVLSVAFSHLRDPEDLAAVACVCRQWRRAVEEEFDDGVWRAVAESRGLGVVGDGGGAEDQAREGGATDEDAEARAAAAATTADATASTKRAAAVAIDRRALRSGRPPLPEPGQRKDAFDESDDGDEERASPSPPPRSFFTWKDRVSAAWPELCSCCRRAVTGRTTLARQGGEGSGGGGAKTLVIRLCHACSSSISSPAPRSPTGGEDLRLVDARGALEILKGAAKASTTTKAPPAATTPPPLLLSRLPRALDLPPQSLGFAAVELYRRRDVRAVALGFERDVDF